MLVVVTAVVAVTLHWRIRTLEAQRSNLREELHDVKMHLKRLVERVDTIASLAIPPRSQQAHNSKTTMEPHENDDYGDKEQPVNLGGRKKLAKRSAHERSKESQYASSSYSLNALNNDTSASFEVDEWTTNKTPVEMSKSSTGKAKNAICGNKSLRVSFRKKIRQLKIVHRLRTRSLKDKLRTLANISCCNECSSFLNLSQPSANSVTKSRNKSEWSSFYF